MKKPNIFWYITFGLISILASVIIASLNGSGFYNYHLKSLYWQLFSLPVLSIISIIISLSITIYSCQKFLKNYPNYPAKKIYLSTIMGIIVGLLVYSTLLFIQAREFTFLILPSIIIQYGPIILVLIFFIAFLAHRISLLGAKNQTIYKFLKKLPAIYIIVLLLFLVIYFIMTVLNTSSCDTSYKFLRTPWRAEIQSKCLIEKNKVSLETKNGQATDICSDAEDKDSCFYELAQETKDGKYCDLIEPTKPDEYGRFMHLKKESQTTCYVHLGRSLNDPEYCSKALTTEDEDKEYQRFSADGCYLGVAHALEDGLICKNIANEKSRIECGVQLHACESILDPEKKLYLPKCPEDFHP